MLFTPAVLLVPEKPAIMAEARPQIIRPDAPRLVLPATFLPFPMAMIGAGSSTFGPTTGTLNASDKYSGIGLSGGNLSWTVDSVSTAGYFGAKARATVSQSTGKRYAEFKITSSPGSGKHWIGICTSDAQLSAEPGGDADGGTHKDVGVYCSGTAFQIYINGVSTVTTDNLSHTTNDFINLSVDLSAKRLYIAKNGTNAQISGVAMNASAGTGGVDITSGVSGSMFPCVGANNTTGTGTVNFGATSFNNTVPTGYSSWG